MAITAGEVERLEKRIADRNNAQAQAQGAKTQLLTRLQTEFGVATLEEAKVKQSQFSDRLRLLETKTSEEASNISQIATAAGF